MKLVHFTVEGKIPSKKNAWRRGARTVYLNETVQSDIDALVWQLKSVRAHSGLLRPISGPVEINAVFHVQTDKIDLDNAYTTLQDALQTAGFLENDRLVSKVTFVRKIIKSGQPFTRVVLKF